MSRYSYEAMDYKGREVKGVVVAISEASALTAVKDKGLFPTRISEEITSQSKEADPVDSSEPVRKTIDLGWFRLRIRIQIWMEKKK